MGNGALFKAGIVMSNHLPLCLTNPYTIYAPYLSNHCIKVWALYLQNHGLSSTFVMFYAEKLPKVWEISDNFVICFKMFENVLKPGNMVCYCLLRGFVV